MYMKQFPTVPYVLCGSLEAELTKYFCNCFLATKVSFANEMKQFCDKKNIDYDKVCEYALYDTRMGRTHLAVPGPDGDRGFGGHCFPKDLAAMIYFGEMGAVDTSFLKSVNEKNDTIRTNRDWEKMAGRAVSED